MLQRAHMQDEQIISEYIGEDFVNCIYLYMNFRRYGCSREEVPVYFALNRREELQGVLLKYHDCLHIYAKGEREAAAPIAQAIADIHPRVIFVNESFSGKLADVLSQNYTAHRMPLMEKTYAPAYSLSEICKAKPEDLPEIAALLADDDVFKDSYGDKKALAREMAEREADRYGCTYLIRENGRVIWTSSVVAQADDAVIESLIWLAPEKRRQGLGKASVSALANRLIEQGKRVFLFPVEQTIPIYESAGSVCVAQTVKWIRF